MSVAYKPVLWDRSKIVYDLVLLIAVIAYLYIFIRIAQAPEFTGHTKAVDTQITRMRAFGSCAFFMLSFILMIGPLARLDRRFLPLLYNRRHFGVLTCTVAAAHAIFVVDWYFNFSPIDSYVALLSSNQSTGQLLGFPFELFGIAAFAIMLVLAVTSHDFWLKFLTPPVWKGVHMLIYVAYALVVAHVAFGYLQDVRSGVFPALFIGAAGLVAGLHVAASVVEGRREQAAQRQGADAAGADGQTWIEAEGWWTIEEGRAMIVAAPGGERIAIFRHDGRLSAISNVCAHQNGPLGEGRIIDGCVTCPWHGYQFRPDDGCAPAPFTDKVPVYPLRFDGARLLVRAAPEALGTRVPPVAIPAAAA